MTAPALPHAAIEVEARAYVEAYGHETDWMRPPFRYLRGLIAILDARDAEIAQDAATEARLRAEIASMERRFDQQGMIHLALRQEIARLRAPPGADVTNQGYEAGTTEAARWSPGLWAIRNKTPKPESET